MASTRNLMASCLYSLPFLGYQPVNVSNFEPAMTAANLTKQTMLGAPFSWPWNRDDFIVEIAVTDISGNPIVPAQDYVVTMPNFGFLEKAWLTDAKGNVKEIKVVLGLASESSVQRPASVAAQYVSDTDGTVVLRLNAIPDQAYYLSGYFQRAPNLMTSLASSWAPIPDNLGYIYDWGFLYHVSMLTKDVRTQWFGQRFAAHLIGAQDGLTATQRNIFFGNFLDVLTEPQRAVQRSQQGVAAGQV
jgi:hypothetical protein